MNKILKILLIPAVITLNAIPAHAAIFTARYTGTVSGNNGVQNVNIGDTAVITYQLDNGGTSALNQTWTGSDLVSVTFNFGNGAHVTTLNPNGGDGLNASTGNFVTNGLGQLSSVPISWADISNVNTIFTNSSQVVSGWSVSGVNSIFTTQSFQFGIDLANVDGTTDPANWIIVEAQPQSTPESSATLGLLAIGLLGITVLKLRNAS